MRISSSQSGKLTAKLHASAIEKTAKHFFGFEDFSRDHARPPRVMRIIAINFAHRLRYFRNLPEPEEASPITIGFAEPGFLCDDRSTGGEVTGAAITEPSGIQSHVLIFRDRKLGL